MITSPFIVYSGQIALDVRKTTMWSPNGSGILSTYTRCTTDVPTDVPSVGFLAAKQADLDAAPFVK
jgi:hypothetical protein